MAPSAYYYVRISCYPNVAWKRLLFIARYIIIYRSPTVSFVFHLFPYFVLMCNKDYLFCIVIADKVTDRFKVKCAYITRSYISY